MFKAFFMEENQNIDYKRIWKDEYLQWICGFANAQGGKLFIGIDDDKTLRVFNKIDQKNNNIPIIIKEKEELKANKKIEIIEDTDDSFIEELTDLLIKVDTKGKLQIKRENNKNEERIQFLTEENKEEVKNDYEDLLNKKFAIYEDEEKNEKEKKEEEIIIFNIFSNKRPPTSYGGVNERERSIQNSIRSKNQKNY